MSGTIWACRSRWRFWATLLVAALCILAIASAAPAGKERNKKGWEFAKVYTYAYDEVFEGAQEAIEQRGWLVTAAEKEQGVIAGRPASPECSITFTFHIQPIEARGPKPATKVTIAVNSHGFGCLELRERVAGTLCSSFRGRSGAVLIDPPRWSPTVYEPEIPPQGDSR